MNKKLFVWIYCLWFLGGCISTPVEDWRKNFHNIIAEIGKIKAQDGEIKDYKVFYEHLDALAAFVHGTEYGIDLLKDLLLTSENIPVRAASAEVLGMKGKIKDAFGIIPALRDRSVLVREKALKALKKLTHEDFGYDRNQWLQWWQGFQEQSNEE